MSVHIPTLLLVLVVVGLVVSISVGAIANRQQRDGTLYWALGLGINAVSYVLLSQFDTLGQTFSIVGATFLRACAWAAFAEGLYAFYGRPAPRVVIWAPVVLIFLSIAVLHDHLVLRVVSNVLITTAQILLVFLVIWRMRRDTPGRGKYFLLTGVAMALALSLLRSAVAIAGDTMAMVSPSSASPIQIISALVVLMVQVLLSIGFVLMAKDRAENLSRRLAIRDDLTGLANRRHMNEVLGSEWARARRSGQALALLMIDVDHFKQYNDQYGHQAGDACLRQVAQVIAGRAARAGDLAARYGGEEFLLILPATDEADAKYLAESLCTSVEALALAHLGSPGGKVTVSVGVAVSHDNFYRDAESLLRAADEALYRAKHGGRNQVQVALAALAQGQRALRAPVKLMQLIWRRVYESGNPTIDTQHRTLFSDANKLLNAFVGDQPAQELEKLAQVFVFNIAQHFEAEEAIIKRAGYPGAHAHAESHRALLAEAEALLAGFRAGTVAMGELFQYLVHEVVARHVLIADRDFFSSLSPSPPDPEPLTTRS
jgi:diguanylate cyclase (GGDEF)-like protein/hemerythrin-like metal-binding protein